MTIAEQLTAISEKNAEIKSQIPLVYYSGYERGYGDGYVEGEEDGFSAGWWDVETTVTSVLESPFNKVKEYTNDLDTNQYDSISTIQYIDEKLPEVYAMGERDGVNAWWLKFQQKKEEYGYRNAFWGESWSNEIYAPVRDIVAVSGKSQNEMFRGAAITDTKVPIYFKQSGATYVFSSGYIQKIPLLDVVESVTYANWFTNATSLTDITMSGTIGNDIGFQFSPLNKASIQSIIGCLSSTASGKTLTLKESAVLNAFDSLEGEEWLNLINTKSNWTISTYKEEN